MRGGPQMGMQTAADRLGHMEHMNSRGASHGATLHGRGHFAGPGRLSMYEGGGLGYQPFRKRRRLCKLEGGPDQGSWRGGPPHWSTPHDPRDYRMMRHAEPPARGWCAPVDMPRSRHHDWYRGGGGMGGMPSPYPGGVRDFRGMQPMGAAMQRHMAAYGPRGAAYMDSRLDDHDVNPKFEVAGEFAARNLLALRQHQQISAQKKEIYNLSLLSHVADWRETQVADKGKKRKVKGRRGCAGVYDAVLNRARLAAKSMLPQYRFIAYIEAASTFPLNNGGPIRRMLEEAITSVQTHIRDMELVKQLTICLGPKVYKANAAGSTRRMAQAIASDWQKCTFPGEYTRFYKIRGVPNKNRDKVPKKKKKGASPKTPAASFAKSQKPFPHAPADKPPALSNSADDSDHVVRKSPPATPTHKPSVPESAAECAAKSPAHGEAVPEPKQKAKPGKV